MKAIGYIRVSTDEQAKDGLSLDAQRERIESFCIAKDWTLETIINDPGYSGKNLNRPGIQKIIEAVKAGTFDVLVICKLDRMTRNIRDLGYLTQDVFEVHDVAFSSIADNFDTTTANGKLVLNILGSVAQWERDIVVERTTDALQHKRSKGEWAGRIPYGFLICDSGKLTENPEEIKTIQKAKRMKRNGHSIRDISKRLHISKSLVQRIINDNLKSIKARYVKALT
jgi:site-specific DNA recombinase